MAYQFSRKGCFKCGNRMSDRSCSQKYIKLFEVGHIAESCTSQERLCYNCRQPGHESAACPQPRTVATKQCYSCGGEGHIQAECPSLRLAGGNQKCYVRDYPSSRYKAGLFIQGIYTSAELWSLWPYRTPVSQCCRCNGIRLSCSAARSWA